MEVLQRRLVEDKEAHSRVAHALKMDVEELRARETQIAQELGRRYNKQLTEYKSRYQGPQGNQRYL